METNARQNKRFHNTISFQIYEEIIATNNSPSSLCKILFEEFGFTEDCPNP